MEAWHPLCCTKGNKTLYFEKEMRTAFSYWNDRIAPVFDTSRSVLVVETELRTIVRETPAPLSGDLPLQKVRQLVGLGVATLVCGAISNSLEGVIVSYGIQVIPFVAGELRQVINAWLSDRLYWRRFTMPGCRSFGGRRYRRMHGMHPDARINCEIYKDFNTISEKGGEAAGAIVR